MRALVTGIFGQDGSYLTQILSQKGFDVIGVARHQLSAHSQRIKEHLSGSGYSPGLESTDLTDAGAVQHLIETVQPDRIFHLAASHSSSEGDSQPSIIQDRNVFSFNTFSALNILTSVAAVAPKTRVVMAGSCLMFDQTEKSPQNENTTFSSRSVYGQSKIAAAKLGMLFRERHCLHVSTAIVFNHESPRRGAQFVTQKVVQGLVRIQQGKQDVLELGNLTTVKDWGFAPEYVDGLIRMAELDQPEDFILATGKKNTVEDLVRVTADVLQLNWQDVVRTRDGLVRQNVSDTPLVGDPSKAKKLLGWEAKTDLKQLVELMVRAELEGDLGVGFEKGK